MKEGMFICLLVKTGSKSTVRDGSSAPVIMDTSTDDSEIPLQKQLYLGRDYRRTDGPIRIIFGWCRANIIPNVVLEVHHDRRTQPTFVEDTALQTAPDLDPLHGRRRTWTAGPGVHFR